MEPDFWFWQRYYDLLLTEHDKDHPNSDATNCVYCKDKTE